MRQEALQTLTSGANLDSDNILKTVTQVQGLLHLPTRLFWGGIAVCIVSFCLLLFFNRRRKGRALLFAAIPLFLCGLKKIGRHFFFGSLYSTVLTSIFLDLFARILPVPTVEPLVAALFGGVFMGVSLGLVFLGNASTGGVDIVARLMKLKFRNFPIGKIILCMDLTIAVITGVVYRDFNNTLYSVIAMVVSSMALDRVVYGMDYSKVALIITEKYEAIATAIDSQLDRGVTLLKGQGYYKRQDKMVLLSAVKRKQLAELKELVMDIDPDAFIILQDAHQVLGDGFKRYDRNEL